MPPKRYRFFNFSKSRNASPAPSRPSSPVRPSAVTQKGADAPSSAHAVPSASQVTSSSTSGNLAPNTGSKVKEVASVAWEGVKTSLALLNESAGCLPPLKAAVGGLVALIDAIGVSKTNLPLRLVWRILLCCNITSSYPTTSPILNRFAKRSTV